MLLLFLVENVFAATSVTSHAITWNFDSDYTIGQYITGDYYVVAPSGLQVTSITPDGSGTDDHGSMVNPVPGLAQGYTSRTAGYDRGLNVAYSMPVSLSPGDSLISTYTAEVYHSWTQDGSVLTIVSEAPPSGSFRPPYVGTNKPIHNISEINWAKLSQLTPAGTPPSQSTVERWVERPWLSHGQGNAGTYITPANNMPPYGRDVIDQTGQIALWLNLDYPQAMKQQALHGFLQVGIDWYYTAVLPGAAEIWAPDGGTVGGRKMPILFAGKVMENSSMLSIASRTGDYLYDGTLSSDGTWTPPSDFIHFHMDDQTFYVSQHDVDITNSGYWNPDTRVTVDPYNSSHIGMPEWSIRYGDTTTKSNANWQATYRSNTNGQYYSGVILSALIMGLKEHWNHDALFDYTIRYQAISKGDPDPFGYTVPGETADYRPDNFQNAMWDTYRDNYPLEATGLSQALQAGTQTLDPTGTQTVVTTQ